MKLYYTRVLFFTMFFIYQITCAQQSMLPTSLFDDFTTPLPAKTISSKDIIISYTLDEDQFYSVKMEYEEKNETFKLKPLTYPNFKAKFKNALHNLLSEVGKVLSANSTSTYTVNDLTSQEVKKADNEISAEFAKIITYFNTEEERPLVATIRLKEFIKVYSNGLYLQKLENPSAKITFYDGFIEKIQVKGKISQEEVIFSNNYSIGISSTKNIEKLHRVLLHSENRFNKLLLINNSVNIKDVINSLPSTALSGNDLDNKFEQILTRLYIQEYLKSHNYLIKNYVTQLKNNFEKNKQSIFSSTLKSLLQEVTDQYQNRQTAKDYFLTINLGDVIQYEKEIDVNANDVSPVKQLILLDSKAQKETKLYKEESTRLFEAVVYTDFLSLFDEENPNGLVQTEVNKRFNINTRRSDIVPESLPGLIPPFFPFLISEGYGFFQYFDAQLQISKIEKNNKFLSSRTILIEDETGIMVDSEPFYEPLTMLQHRNYAIGGMLNIVNFENQNAKLLMNFNAGFLFGRSGYIPVGEDPTAETVNTEFVNNLEIPMEYKFHLLPEKRFSIMLSDRLSWFENLDADIPLRSVEDQRVTSQNRWLNSFNIDLNLDLSSTGKLFLRYRLVHELDNINNNFSQLQFGYSFYFLKNNKPVK